MNKTEIRKKYKSLRNLLTSQEIENKSIAIANELLTMEIWHFNVFHLFSQITEQNEVNTEYIFHILNGKDKDIIVPKTKFETLEMQHYILTENTKFKKNNYNITEPINGFEVPTNKIEVVFVPLLAFDFQGNRVGYGKGFYDRFLSHCNPSTQKIGLSFFAPEPVISDVSETDIKLDFCVTPHQIYTFK